MALRGLWFQSPPVPKRLALREPHGFGLVGAGEPAFLQGVNGPADRGECGVVLARHGCRFDQSAAAAPHGPHTVIVERISI